jgi:hypothetical protein
LKQKPNYPDKIAGLVRERGFVTLAELSAYLNLTYYYVRTLCRVTVELPGNDDLQLVDYLMMARERRELGACVITRARHEAIDRDNREIWNGRGSNV